VKPGELDIHHEQADSRHVLHLAGELDLSCVDVLERRIAVICSEGALSIELDLAELEFVDSAGLRAMLEGRDVCRRAGCALVLRKCNERVRRVLELTGMDSVLQISEGVGAHAAEVPAWPADTAAAD
jgi:anti-sigma B factor antagonist